MVLKQTALSERCDFNIKQCSSACAHPREGDLFNEYECANLTLKFFRYLFKLF